MISGGSPFCPPLAHPQVCLRTHEFGARETGHLLASPTITIRVDTHMIEPYVAPLHPDPVRDQEMRDTLRKKREYFTQNCALLTRLAAESVRDYLLREEATYGPRPAPQDLAAA